MEEEWEKERKEMARSCSPSWPPGLGSLAVVSAQTTSSSPTHSPSLALRLHPEPYHSEISRHYSIPLIPLQAQSPTLTLIKL